MTAVSKFNQIVHMSLEHGIKRYWRPVAAYVYLAICLFDFVGAPAFVAIENASLKHQVVTEFVMSKDPAERARALDALKTADQQWQPMTLKGGGLFHLSFGAILGVAAYTRGQEKKIALQGENESE